MSRLTFKCAIAALVLIGVTALLIPGYRVGEGHGLDPGISLPGEGEPSAGQRVALMAPPEEVSSRRTPQADGDSTQATESGGRGGGVQIATTTSSLFQCEVSDENGVPVGGAKVAVVGSDESVLTDELGQCELGRTVPDADQVLVCASAKGRVSVTRNLRGGVQRLLLVLPAEAELYLTLEDLRTGIGVADAVVTAAYAGAKFPYRTHFSDDLGHVGPVTVPANTTFELTVRAEHYTDYVGRHVVPLTDAGLPGELTIVLMDAVDTTFYIVDAQTHLPVAEARLKPVFDLGRKWISGADGSAVVPDWSSGDGAARAILVDADGYCSVVVNVTKGLEGGGVVIVVPIYPEIIVRGVTVDDGGSPLGGVDISVEYARRPNEDGEHGWFLMERDQFDWPEYVNWNPGNYVTKRKVVSDESGKIVISNLPPGLVGLNFLGEAPGRNALMSVEGFDEPGVTKDVVIRVGENAVDR